MKSNIKDDYKLLKKWFDESKNQQSYATLLICPKCDPDALYDWKKHLRSMGYNLSLQISLNSEEYSIKINTVSNSQSKYNDMVQLILMFIEDANKEQP